MEIVNNISEINKMSGEQLCNVKTNLVDFIKINNIPVKIVNMDTYRSANKSFQSYGFSDYNDHRKSSQKEMMSLILHSRYPQLYQSIHFTNNPKAFIICGYLGGISASFIY